MERFVGLCCMPLTTYGAPLDAAQHPEELCTIDSFDLFWNTLQALNRYELEPHIRTWVEHRRGRSTGALERCLATDTGFWVYNGIQTEIAKSLVEAYPRKC